MVLSAAPRLPQVHDLAFDATELAHEHNSTRDLLYERLFCFRVASPEELCEHLARDPVVSPCAFGESLYFPPSSFSFRPPSFRTSVAIEGTITGRSVTIPSNTDSSG